MGGGDGVVVVGGNCDETVSVHESKSFFVMELFSP